MSFDEFVHWCQSLLALVIALFGAIGSGLTLFKALRDRPKHDSAPAARVRMKYVLSGLFALIALVILVVYLRSPRVAITEPRDGGTVNVMLLDSGSAQFTVRGSAARLASNSRRRIYLLVHPDQPPAPGWWIQPDVAIDSAGHWNGTAWFGTRGWEAKPGQTLWLQAVIAARQNPLPAGSDGVPWVSDPEGLEPATASTVVRVSVAAVTRQGNELTPEQRRASQ